jgi:hypothetical protein
MIDVGQCKEAELQCCGSRTAVGSGILSGRQELPSAFKAVFVGAAAGGLASVGKWAGSQIATQRASTGNESHFIIFCVLTARDFRPLITEQEIGTLFYINALKASQSEKARDLNRNQI